MDAAANVAYYADGNFSCFGVGSKVGMVSAHLHMVVLRATSQTSILPAVLAVMDMFCSQLAGIMTLVTITSVLADMPRHLMYIHYCSMLHSYWERPS